MGGDPRAPPAAQPLDGPTDGGRLKLDAFERMVRRMAEEIPEHYLDGILAIDVSPRTVPHPSRADVFTLGECVPVEGEGEDASSRVVLYHGSFRALAALTEAFDWRHEAWETLTHELRHHIEWRARAGGLEAYDWAAEQNFARQAGEPFDALFFLSGEPVGEGQYQVDDDVFVDRAVRSLPARVTIPWRGRAWTVEVPAGSLPLFLAVDGIPVPPAGDLFVVLRRPPGILDLFRGRREPRSARAVARSPAAD